MNILQEIGFPIIIVYTAIGIATSRGLNIHQLAISVDILEKTMRIFFFLCTITYMSHHMDAPDAPDAPDASGPTNPLTCALIDIGMWDAN